MPLSPDAPRAATEVAVIGSGVAGLMAAHLISRQARVTLYEAAGRLGGHADTHAVDQAGRELHIDTGFIVHNRRTYPTLIRLFDELGIRTQDSEMSMSISGGPGVEWAGALGRAGIFPTAAAWRSLDHWRMLVQIPRFHRAARRLLHTGNPDDLTTLAEFVAAQGFSEPLIRGYLEPLVAAVWSTEPDRALEFPAVYLFRFLAHHGMLQIFGSPTWRTVTGGSKRYVDAVAAGIAEIRTDSPVGSVRETAGGVWVDDPEQGERRFDAVVIATHPRQALDLLKEPTEAHHEILGALTYSPNRAILHTDTSVMPTAPRAWASWNFRRRTDSGDPAAGSMLVSYDLTRLQRLPTDQHYLVTLGGADLIDPTTIIDTMDYEHPLYTPDSVAAQRRLPELNTARIAYAGAYHGWGFHEDGAASGLAAATHLGFGSAPAPVARTGVYATTVTHTRRTPWRRSFTNTSQHQVVDIDQAPPGVQARDHLGDPDRSLRENLAAFLALHDIELGDRRVLLATHPRAFGFCFNPISVWWVLDPAGDPAGDQTVAATVVEVHNTYGDRHAYVLPGATSGTVDKAMYVSPFHGTDGGYRVAAPLPDDRLDIAVSLDSDDGAVFSAALTGRRIDHPGRRTAAVGAVAGARDAVAIRLHGIVLWLRRLPIRPRPTHHQEGVR